MAKKRIERKNRTKSVVVPQKNLLTRVMQAHIGGLRTDLPDFSPGDTVRVHVRIKEGEKERLQAFDGVCIKRSHRAGSFIVRKISHGVGVERIFMENSTKVAKIDILEAGRVRRAKLYYLRGLEGKAAKIDREVETQASIAQKQAAKSSAKAAAKTAPKS